MLLSVVDLSSVLLFAVTFLTLYVVYRSRSNRKYPPSLPWLPVVGSLPFVSFNLRARFFTEKAATLGDVIGVHLPFNRYAIAIKGRETIHEALVTRSADFADRPSRIFNNFKLPQSLGLIGRPYGEDFKTIKHQSLSILKEFGFGKRIMETRIEGEVSHLIQFTNELKGEAFDFHDILTIYVINVIHSILFGSRRESNDPKLVQLIQAIGISIGTHAKEPGVPFILRFLPNAKRQQRIGKLNDLIISHINEALTSEADTESFVHSFTKNGGEFLELAGIVRDLIIAGSETTTTTLFWSLVLLANHPEVQDRLHKEIDSVVPKDRLPTLDDRPNLPYVEASTMEVMRHKTLLPFSVPRMTYCDTELSGYFIPKSTLVLVNLYGTHMDPKVWEDPTTFRPERFLDDGGNVVGKNLVIPFGLGKRSCLGEQLARQELFLFFTGLLQNFDIRPPDGQDLVDDTENAGLTMSPSRFKVRLIPRRDHE